MLSRPPQGVGPVVGQLHAETLRRQPAPDDVRQRDLVFHDQHTHASHDGGAGWEPGRGT